MKRSNDASVDFDQHAENYGHQLNRGLVLSGEGKEYFAQGRIRWLARSLEQLGLRPKTVLDFGCGDGSSADLFVEILGAQTVVGVDISAKLLALANAQYASDRIRFVAREEAVLMGPFDLVFSNGVFHHVPPADRPQVVDCIRELLAPAGVFALWENNPWNLGARLVMWRIPFDRNAVPLSPRGAGQLLQQVGLKVLRTDYHFIFPRALRFFRRLEPRLARWPLGAQYQMLAAR